MIAIYVIDPDPAVRLAARRILEPAGFAVGEAAAVPAAAGAADPVPGLVITRQALAESAARAYPAARILPIGGTAGLEAPFTASRLLAAVRRCLARPRDPG